MTVDKLRLPPEPLPSVEWPGSPALCPVGTRLCGRASVGSACFARLGPLRPGAQVGHRPSYTRCALFVFPSSRAKTTRVTSVTSAWRPGGLGAPAGAMSGRRVRLSVGSHVPPWHLGESFWEDLIGLCPDGALPQRPEEELSGPVGSPHRGRSAHGHPGGRLRCERVLLAARRSGLNWP